MNMEIGAEAAQFPEKEYINGIAVAVCLHRMALRIFHFTLHYITQTTVNTISCPWPEYAFIKPPGQRV
jgi:hypothetical protein